MVDDKNEDNNDKNAVKNKGTSRMIITYHKNAKLSEAILGNIEDDLQRDHQKVDSISMATAGLKSLCIFVNINIREVQRAPGPRLLAGGPLSQLF